MLPSIFNAIDQTVFPIVLIGSFVLTALIVAMLILLFYQLFNRLHTEAKFKSLIPYLEKMVSENDPVSCPENDQKHLQKHIIHSCTMSNESHRIKMKQLYIKTGFLSKDVQLLSSKRWWKKLEVLERWLILKDRSIENEAFDCLSDKSLPVRSAALRVLCEIKSVQLYNNLHELFSSNSRWAYRYLINQLYSGQVPPSPLIPFVYSIDRDLRKAAAILLGSTDSEESFKLLSILSTDPVKDIRFEALKSLSDKFGSGADEIIYKAATDEHSKVRVQAAISLGIRRTEKALSLLKKLANDKNFDVSHAAFFALSRCGERGLHVIEELRTLYPEIAREFLECRQ